MKTSNKIWISLTAIVAIIVMTAVAFALSPKSTKEQADVSIKEKQAVEAYQGANEADDLNNFILELEDQDVSEGTVDLTPNEGEADGISMKDKYTDDDMSTSRGEYPGIEFHFDK